jgi:LCP family protein required for cell wall assembly
MSDTSTEDFYARQAEEARGPEPESLPKRHQRRKGRTAGAGVPGAPWHSRRRRVTIWILTAASAVLVIVLGIGLATYLTANHYLDSMKRIHDPFSAIPFSARAPKPLGAAASDTTFLVGGLDTAQGTGAGSGRTDTLMLVHLIAGGRGAYVVSIPRDSWVPIPGYGDGKVNWSYFFGGPTLAVRTVEQLTHVRIDHVAVINWDGFQAVTNALGGVTVDIPQTVDESPGLVWTAGVHHLDGAQALNYVRDRYGLATGDFDREARQQYFLRAVFTQLGREGRLTNPLQSMSVLHALSQAISVDSTLSNGALTSFALSLRSLSPSKILFATAPYTGTGWVGSQSVVFLNQSLDPGFWHAFEYDSLPAFMKAHNVQQLGTTTP